jgi:hypothetical protein
MKQSCYLCSVLILAAALNGCTKKGTPSIAFDADTLRGATATFTSVEKGVVTLKPGAFDQLGEVDDTGALKHFTSDVVESFSGTTAVNLKDRQGMAVRFIVPPVADNDYCVISAEITTPAPVDIGGGLTTSIRADFRYDAKNLGRTEYIWFIFSENAPKLMIPGAWKITLYNKGAKLVSADFTVR